MMMEEIPGSMGTSTSLALRFGQTIFATAALFFMCLDVDFYGYTAFCFLVTIMGLVIPWSTTLALVDAYCVCVKRPPRQGGIIVVLIIGDWVLSFLSLAAASSTASVAQLLLSASNDSPGNSMYCPMRLCTRYPLSALMAFLSWFLSFGSCLFNIWLLPKL